MTETTQPAPLAIIGAEYDIMWPTLTPGQITQALTDAVTTYEQRCRHWEDCLTEFTAAAEAAAAGTPGARARLTEARITWRIAGDLAREQGKMVASLARAANARQA